MKIKLLVQSVVLSAMSICSFCTISNAQVAPQNIFLEAGGPGLLFSLNYDTRFGKTRDGFGYRVGAGFFTDGGDGVLTIPAQLNYLAGDGKNFFEAGFGGTYVSLTSSRSGLFGNAPAEIIGTVTLGYRYQPANSGVNFRISYNPVFDSSVFVPVFFGISVGYTIK